MCCKLPHIRDLSKPAGKWCQHVRHGQGCSIYAARPGDCRAFVCDWMINPKLTPEWKPDICKFLIYMTADGNCSVLVDEGNPTAWRGPKYYPVLKTFAAELVQRGRLMTVAIGEKFTAVLPNKDVELGLMPPGHGIQVSAKMTHGWPDYTAVYAPLGSLNANPKT